ncbi:2-haloacid dehalogenase [Chitinophaga polysaccharea]|uniref:2-haloacid dehalogenase n=1 Tax=Chitinophaga polysaccharea TaxID=1293035 RepID=A0A561PG31_9BACT|nr:HAD family phosphatase [Chitinophaga polysaccharea]TWF37077.1 2-haloacid dehalogenase [Chitinophaga polysaccharea]
MRQTISTIIFDLGAVLIDWNPRHLYRKIFSSEEEMEAFLRDVCTSDWNEVQDEGRSLEEGTNLLIKSFPQHETNIRAYYGRWEEMLGGEIEGTKNILQQLKESGQYKLYALTNWSNETFPIAWAIYPSLHWFDGIVVSGKEKIRKPDHAFYQLLLNRYQVPAAQALFIDDNIRNVIAAREFGIDSILFENSHQLKNELEKRSIIV